MKGLKEKSGSGDSEFVLGTLKLVHILGLNRFINTYRMFITLVEHGLIELIASIVSTSDKFHLISAAVLRRVCALSVQHGETQKIQMTAAAYNDMTLVSFDAQVSVDDRVELEDDNDVNVGAMTTTSAAMSQLAVGGESITGYLTDDQVFNERERLSQYDIVNDEFNIFRSDETFDQLKDGSLTDCACALLNGRRRGQLWIGLSPEGMITGVAASATHRDKFRQRMFKLMRSMFPPVMTDQFRLHFFSVQGDGQERTLVRIQFTPHGLMYSTPQKRCCVREVPKEGEIDLGLTKVLDMREVVQRCLDQEVYPHVHEIERLKRAIEVAKIARSKLDEN